MTVRVHLAPVSHGDDTYDFPGTVEHPDADGIDTTSAGALLVGRGIASGHDMGTVAAYAPGRWYEAVVEREPACTEAPAPEPDAEPVAPLPTYGDFLAPYEPLTVGGVELHPSPEVVALRRIAADEPAEPMRPQAIAAHAVREWAARTSTALRHADLDDDVPTVGPDTRLRIFGPDRIYRVRGMSTDGDFASLDLAADDTDTPTRASGRIPGTPEDGGVYLDDAEQWGNDDDLDALRAAAGHDAPIPAEVIALHRLDRLIGNQERFGAAALGRVRKVVGDTLNAWHERQRARQEVAVPVRVPVDVIVAPVDPRDPTGEGPVDPPAGRSHDEAVTILYREVRALIALHLDQAALTMGRTSPWLDVQRLATAMRDGETPLRISEVMGADTPTDPDPGRTPRVTVTVARRFLAAHLRYVAATRSVADWPRYLRNLASTYESGGATVMRDAGLTVVDDPEEG